MHLNIQINSVEDAAKGRKLFEDSGLVTNDEVELIGIGILERGMQSGEPSVMIQIRTGPESGLVVQLSAKMFLAAAGAVRGASERFGYTYP